VYGNLGTTLGGSKAGLTGAQGKLLGKLAALKQNENQRSGAITRGSKRSVANMYGSATGGAMASAQKSVAAAGRAGRTSVASQVAAGGILAKGNKAAFTTLEQGVEMAKAGAKGQLADALAYRAKNDAQLQAQSQLALDQMRLQNQLDIQNYKKKLQLQQNAENQQGNAAAGALASVASDAVPGLLAAFNDQTLANGGEGLTKDGRNYVTPVEAANAYAAEQGIQPGTAEYQVILSAAQAVRASADAGPDANWDPNAISQSVSQQLAILYPNLTPSQLQSLQGITQASSANWTIDNSTYTAGKPAVHQNYVRNIFGPIFSKWDEESQTWVPR